MEENEQVTLVATADPAANEAAIAELDRRIRELEAAIGDLRTVNAQASATGRKTVAAGMSVMAKHDDASGSHVDEALRSLSVEQRIAVKSGLMRAGLL